MNEEILLMDGITSRIAMLVRDLVSYRNRIKDSGSSINTDGKHRRGFLNIYFDNKGIDMVNLPTILHSKRVRATVPTYLNNISPPIVSYTYPKTIASKVFNFKQTLKNLDFEVGTTGSSCQCNGSPYIYVPAGHVVTGNLNIVKNRHIRKLLMKGPSYREQRNINWNKVEILCMEAICKYRVRWAKKENVDVRVLADWEHEVGAFIRERIAHLKKKYRRWRKERVLRNNKHLQYLKAFHKQFVLVPADKATNNIIVVCKKFYLEVMFSELNVGKQNTYVVANIDYEDIVT